MSHIFESQEQDWQIKNIAHDFHQPLESGQVLFFPRLTFHLNDEEKRLFNLDLLRQKSKNVSYNPHTKKLATAKITLDDQICLHHLFDHLK